MPGVRIDLRKIDEIIARKGVWLDWIRTRRCPCVDDQGYIRVNCPGCEGLGFLRDKPKRIRCLLTSHNPKGRREAAGLVEAGTRSLTPPRWVRLAEGDLIVARQGRMRTSEVITYGEVTPNGSKLEALYPLSVITAQALRGATVHTFDPTQYELMPDGSFAWLAAATDVPAPGERVSIEFYHSETYMVHRDEKSVTRYAEDKRLPDRVTLKTFTRRGLRTE